MCTGRAEDADTWGDSPGEAESDLEVEHLGHCGEEIRAFPHLPTDCVLDYQVIITLRTRMRSKGLSNQSWCLYIYSTNFF